MTLEQYLAILIRQWKLIVICFLVAGAGAAISSRLMTPLYQSAGLVQVAANAGNNQGDYYSLLASDQLVQTEAILATSDPVLREVAAHYSGLTFDQLSKEASATIKLNTQLIEIDVIDPSPTRAATLANDIATTLIKRQLQMTAQGVPQSNLLIVQPAQPSTRPVQPQILLNTGVGLLVGLLLGMLLAVLFEQLDTHIRTSEALSQFLNWPVLATVWQADSSKDAINPKRSDPNIEAYRILRTNVGFSSVDKTLRSLVITSAVSGEGKSVVSANLALFMAKSGKSTLLIDADLRRPTLHKIFGIPSDQMGLSNAIMAFKMQDVAHTVSNNGFSTASLPLTAQSNPRKSFDPFIYTTDIPNLYVMPSGPLPPNPPELLDSKAMQHFFQALSDYGPEMVIFDTPPLLGLSDASILASKSDGTLIVVDITRARKGHLKQLKALLGQAGAHVLGCVVNKQRRNKRDSIYANYYGTDVKNDQDQLYTKAVNKPVTPIQTLDEVKQPQMQHQLNQVDGKKIVKVGLVRQ